MITSSRITENLAEGKVIIDSIFSLSLVHFTIRSFFSLDNNKLPLRFSFALIGSTRRNGCVRARALALCITEHNQCTAAAIVACAN